jgi:hypothetical protein
MTSAGVEFKIHSIMVIGGSKMLEEGLFPGGVSNPVTAQVDSSHPAVSSFVTSWSYTRAF